MATYATAESTSTDRRAEPLSTEVALALAEFKDIEPTDLETPLYDVVDVEALDALFSDTDTDVEGYLRFTIDDCEVFVGSGGEIDIDHA